MFLKKWLKKSFFRGILTFLPVALLASFADAAVLWGIRAFMEILSGAESMGLGAWVGLMLCLTVLRLVFLLFKVRLSESWVYKASSWVMAWFLHRLRALHPKNFHTPRGDSMVEAAYESALVLQNNGGVVFQGAQAFLQLAVFMPVLLYISWPLTLFLFAVVVPVVGVLQRRLHRLGPVEECLLRDRSAFRGALTLARRLFLQWSSRDERGRISTELLEKNRHLRDDGLRAGLRKNGLSLLTESVSVFAMVIVLAFCALLIQRGWMDGAGLVLFCSAVLLCYKPVKECARVLPQVRAVASALKILEDFESLEIKKDGLKTLPKKNEFVKENVFVRSGNFKYSGAEHFVFENLNLAWSCQKPVLVRGRNGAGKSTFLRLLAGLERWESAEFSGAGNVFFVAQDLELPPRRFLREQMARGGGRSSAEILPTESSLTERLSTERSSTERRAASGAIPARGQVLQSFLQAANVAPLLTKTGLSGGERARVALLWALASDCDTLLLDEPFASIALAEREPLLDEFLRAASALNKWVVVVSHDLLSQELESRFSVVHFDGEAAS